MSTEIKSVSGFVRLSPYAAGVVGVETSTPPGFSRETIMRAVPRADFLSAVEKECGVIIIDRTDLPEVKRRRHEVRVGWNYRHMEQEFYTLTAEKARERANELLALAEHLDANPPVDEAQVDALATLIADDGDWETQDADVIARRLVEQGVRVEVES